MKIAFFNATGEPTPNGEGVYGYKAERDAAGRITLLTNLDREGKPTANGAGLTALALTWGANGRVTRVEVRDREGRPALSNGVAAATIEHDSAGNVIRETRIDAEGKLARSTGQEWVLHEIARNERGEVVGRKYFRGEAEGATTLVLEWKVAYDEFGHPVDIGVSGSENWRRVLRRDATGNITEDKYADAEGRPIVGDEGYAIRKRLYEFGSFGSRWIDTYFDPSGARSYAKAGHHRTITEFGPAGVLQRTIFDEFEPGKYRYHRDVSIAEYDGQGNLRRNITRREDEKGELAANAGLPYTLLEQSFDENNNVFLEWFLGCPESEGAPAWSVDVEYHRTGAIKRHTRQACDSNRKPLPYTSTGISARTEKEYNAIGAQERLHESGFNESVGYNVRETKISNGALMSVSHKRSDGSAVAVQVIITGITLAQPKSAELKVGDQLLAVNGTPVPSAYHFFYDAFPGGWLEVLRDGQRLRIEGFEAGSVGLDLEDRAAANP